MKIKFLSFLVALIMLFGMVTVPVSANVDQVEDYSQDISFLNATGISDISLDTVNDTLTRRVAVNMVLGLCAQSSSNYSYNGEFVDVASNDNDAGKFLHAVKTGLIAKTTADKFLPDGKVKHIDALKMVFNALNYGAMVKSMGKGDSQYYKLANDNDVNIKPQNSQALTVGEFAHILVLSADVPLLMISSVEGNGDVKYTSNKNITALTQYYGIYRIQGEVTQNNFTSLYESEPLIEPAIVISGVKIKCDKNIDTQNLLARNITVYYTKENMQLVYYRFEDDGDVIRLECEDIVKYSNNTYYCENGKKTIKYNFSRNIPIIYNGVAVTSADYNLFLTKSGMIPPSGHVELIKNDSGSYSCIKITNYEIYVVQGVDVAGQKIVDKYGVPVLNLEDTTNLYICDINGESISFDYIDGMNILNVAESLNGYAAKVIVTADAVEGSLTKYDGEEIQLEGEVFKVSQNFKNYVASGKIKVPAIGEETIIYFDARGFVAICELSPNTGWNYGYLLEKGLTSGMDKKFMVKILVKGNSFIEFDSAPNIRIDGELIKKNPQKAYDTLTVSKLNVPVKYRINVNGEIKEIDTPAIGSGETESSLKLVHEGTSVSWIDYVSAFDGKIFMKPGAISFTVPTTPTGDERDYSVSTVEGAFVKDSKYSVAIYGEDPADLVNTVVVKRTATANSVDRSAIIAVVDKVTRGTDSQGNEVWKVYAVYNGVMQTYTIEDNNIYNHSTDPDPLERGDVVRFSANSRREVKAMERTFDNATRTIPGKLMGETPASHLYPSNGNLDVMFHLAYGKTLNLKNNVMQMQYNDNAGTIQNYYYMGKVIIVDKNEVRVGSVSDLVFDPSGAIASNILLEMRYLRVRTIVVYKN